MRPPHEKHRIGGGEAELTQAVRFALIAAGGHGQMNSLRAIEGAGEERADDAAGRREPPADGGQSGPAKVPGPPHPHCFVDQHEEVAVEKPQLHHDRLRHAQPPHRLQEQARTAWCTSWPSMPARRRRT